MLWKSPSGVGLMIDCTVSTIALAALAALLLLPCPGGEVEILCTTDLHGRAEEFAAQERERFDLAVSRAVAPLYVLCELSLPLVRVGGSFLAMKSVDCGEELQSAKSAISQLGGQLEGCEDYTIPGTDVTHRVVRIRKVRPTPKTFPRAFAKIKKNPLR